MKIITCIFVSCIFVSCANTQKDSNTANFDAAEIIKVIDGDTISVKLQNKIETLRLIGVDTPETVHPTKPVECFGLEASEFSKTMLKPRTTVKLVRDVEARDRYQRLLVYLFLADGKLFNQLLLEQGFARVLDIAPNSAYAMRFASSEASARDRRVGLWQACER